MTLIENYSHKPLVVRHQNDQKRQSEIQFKNVIVADAGFRGSLDIKLSNALFFSPRYFRLFQPQIANSK